METSPDKEDSPSPPGFDRKQRSGSCGEMNPRIRPFPPRRGFGGGGARSFPASPATSYASAAAASSSAPAAPAVFNRGWSSTKNKSPRNFFEGGPNNTPKREAPRTSPSGDSSSSGGNRRFPRGGSKMMFNRSPPPPMHPAAASFNNQHPFTMIPMTHFMPGTNGNVFPRGGGMSGGNFGPPMFHPIHGSPPLVNSTQQFEQDPNNGYFDNNESNDESVGIKAVVEKQGYISLHLRHDIQVDIAPNQAIRIVNRKKATTLSVSGCATQMAMVHPKGRVLQYNSRIEIQTQDFLTEDFLSVKNAKMWPRGISFTANNCALVYLVDQAGARSTTDTFHDLYADNIADNVFVKSCQMMASEYPNHAIAQSIDQLERADYWRTDANLDCWLINDISVKQTSDGLVSVERKHGYELFTLKSSPSNGKARLQSSFLYLTASMGESDSHIFVKSNDRRIHYNGNSFICRNAGHSAGFDESGLLRIW